MSKEGSLSQHAQELQPDVTNSSMPFTDCYDRTPLDSGTQSIRLVRFVRATCARSIQCELHCFPLASTPSYTALSYRWGAAWPTNVIIINGRRFVIRENLWHFLHQKCIENSRDYYWIDAICIDQCNIKERNHQVSLMRDIYRRVRTLL